MTHKKRTVAAEGVNLAFGACKLCAERSVYLIAHIGIAVFHMISAPVFRPEKPLHIARQRACRAEGNIIIRHKFIYYSEGKSLI